MGDHHNIRTVGEWDALPDGTIMLDIGEVCWEKSRNGYWYFPGDYSPHNQGEITLPATILWTPEGA